MSQHHDDRTGGAPHDGRAADRRPPVRWVDVSAAPAPADTRDVGSDVESGVESGVERRIGALFAKVSAPAAFDDAARARVAARLRPSGQGQGDLGRVWSRPRLALGVTFGAVVLLLSGAVIAGGGVRVWWKRLRPDRAPAPAASPESPTRSRQRMPASGSGVGSDTDGQDGQDGQDDRATGAVAQTTPSPAPDSAPEPGAAATQVSAVEAPPRAAPRPRRRQLASRQTRTGGTFVDAPAGGQAEAPLAAPVPPRDTGAPSAASVEPAGPPLPPPSSSWMPAPDPAPRPARGAPTTALAPSPPSQLSQEARLLNVAMVQLRQRRDGAAALATLNDYLARYPRGMLAGEARGARIDALLLLQRKNEALRALDATRLEPVGRGQELLVIRGELRARRGCGDAIRDFDLVLGGAAPAPLEERALFGRAVCRQRQGDEQGARTDAAAYLTRFPAGRFAPSVRRLVDGGRPAR